MKFQFDAEKITLADLQKRIETTDLIPSRASLLDGLATKIQAFGQLGIKSLAQLRNELKNVTRSAALAKAANIDPQYLMLLKREVESYFPKTNVLKEFDWFQAGDIARLEESNIKDIAALFERAGDVEGRQSLAELTGINDAILKDFIQYGDLARVQWVSPTTSRMLIEAGYDSSVKLGNADGNVLYEGLRQINQGDKFFKGTIGLRDVKRLIHAAQFVSSWDRP